MSGAGLAQLLRLASPMLPVGAYSYSHGLEWAVEEGAVRDEQTALRWIRDALAFNIGSLEAPVWRRLYQAWSAGDAESARRWNERFLAARETAELRSETVQMGEALKLVLKATGEIDSGPLDRIEQLAFPTAFSFAAYGLRVPMQEGLIGYLWAWGENQVSAAMKLVPLGQSSGQRILSSVAARIPAAVDHALALPDDARQAFSPMLAILSAQHEVQYSRLFRS